MKQVMYTTSDVPVPESVSVVDAPMPEPGPGQVRIAVKARPLDPADLLLLEGRHLYRPQPPARVGIEGAGVIDAVGDGVELAVGQRVALPSGGTWTEFLVASVDDVIPLPDSLPIEQGCMLPVNPFTAAGLLEGLEEGSWYILDAATSSVGRMCLKLGRRRGLKAIAVVRSDAGRDELLADGAAHVLVDGPDLAERVRALIDGPVVRGLDAVAGEASGRLLDSLSDGGTLIVYGLLASDQVVLSAPAVVFRDLTVTGFSRLRSIRAMAPARRNAIATELAELAAQGVLDTHIEATYPLTEVKAALEHQLRAGRAGKILLVS